MLIGILTDAPQASKVAPEKRSLDFGLSAVLCALCFVLCALCFVLRALSFEVRG
jgi:hypothetical protein